jgi:L-tyrosine isonitrile synthase
MLGMGQIALSNAFMTARVSGTAIGNAKPMVSDATRPHRITLGQIDWAEARNIWKRTAPILDQSKLGATIPERILNVITSPRYRKGSLCDIAFEENVESFMNRIISTVRAGQPIELIIPSFPQKISNPLKTTSKDADMAELSALAKLHELVTQVRKIYPPGMVIYLARDGRLNCSDFGYSEDKSNRYGRNLQEFVDKMGISEEIKFLDIRSAMESHPDFQRAKNAANQETREKFENPGDFAPQLARLKGSALSNINLEGVPTALLVRIFTYPENELSLLDLFAKRQLQIQAERTVFNYLMKARITELLDLYAYMRPNAIRGSVHVGPGKIPIQFHRKKTELLPWMGVAVFHEGTFTIRYDCDARQNSIPVYLRETDPSPFFYASSPHISKFSTGFILNRDPPVHAAWVSHASSYHLLDPTKK